MWAGGPKVVARPRSGRPQGRRRRGRGGKCIRRTPRLWGWGPATERLEIGRVQRLIARFADALWRFAPFHRAADLFFSALQIFKIPFAIQFVVVPNSIPSKPKVGMTIGIDNLSIKRIKNESN